MKFRKKPVVIDAVRWTGTNLQEIKTFVGENARFLDANTEYASLDIFTLEGTHHAKHGDWIIKGVAGEFYPCDAEIFEATYDPT